MLRLLFFPLWLIYEIGYLIRHPWSFNWIAASVWAIITCAGIYLTQLGNWIALSPFFWMAAIAIYYVLKIRLNRRRPEVMRRFREYYRSPAHTERYRRVGRPKN
ncbi:MAG: hypothetical protein FJ110_05565 [Deltaproteobacteria bacterium]|nr:hypothetical protein [Deltaproteobacteria bacterium]